MKTKILLSFFYLALFFSACKKNPTSPGNGTTSQPGCVTNNTGAVYFQNNLSDPYKCDIDGSYVGTVQKSSTSTGYTTTAGSVSYKATQASGYYFYPTVYQNSASLSQCGTITITLQ